MNKARGAHLSLSEYTLAEMLGPGLPNRTVWKVALRGRKRARADQAGI